ncbi:MAG: hypothetical protein GWN84_26140 [Gammaproteobacteria bacterium]|nr:hypothetical protein [Gammaproteobacteria bacterium]NIR91277.1 hypothetical protein [Gammaproteobacteria bacterium]
MAPPAAAGARVAHGLQRGPGGRLQRRREGGVQRHDHARARHGVGQVDAISHGDAVRPRSQLHLERVLDDARRTRRHREQYAAREPE